MKTRIAALALALAFVAAPALGAIAGSGCAPCGEMAQSDTPCTALSAASCCGDLVPTAPAQSAPELSTAHAIVAPLPAAPSAREFAAPRAALPLAAASSPRSLSVVLRL